MIERFCPKCGATGKPLIKGFCLNCFLRNHPDLVKVDKVLDLGQCKRCGKVRVKSHWVELTNMHLIEFVESMVKVKELKDVDIGVEFEILNDKQTKAKILVKGVLDGSMVTFEKEALIKFKSVVCDPCMRINSSYREATLQVRGFEGTPKSHFEQAFREVNSILAAEYKKDPLARIVKVEDLKHGFDVWIGSKRAGKIVVESLAKQFKGKIKASTTLYGVDKQGKKKLRYTFMVRIN